MLAEFDAVAAQGYDDVTRVYEQLIQYSAIDEAVLAEVPYWTAMVARRHTDGVVDAMGRWTDHILRFSRRDQLSVNFVLDRSGLRVRGIELDNHQSRWHEWLIHEPRRWERNRDLISNALRPPTAELGRLQEPGAGARRSAGARAGASRRRAIPGDPRVEAAALAALRTLRAFVRPLAHWALVARRHRLVVVLVVVERVRLAGLTVAGVAWMAAPQAPLPP